MTSKVEFVLLGLCIVIGESLSNPIGYSPGMHHATNPKELGESEWNERWPDNRSERRYTAIVVTERIKSTKSATEGFASKMDSKNMATELNTPQVFIRPQDDSSTLITRTEKAERADTFHEGGAMTTTEMSYVNVNDTIKETNETSIDNIPEPTDNYMNQIYLFTPDLFALKEEVTSMIQDSLSYSGQFSPIDTLNTIPVTAYYNTNDNGDKLTSVTYVVSHNGQFIHQETISSIITKPEVKKHLHKHLATKGWKEYQLGPYKTSWIHKNVVAVVVPTCISFVIILFIIIFACKSRSVNSNSDKKKVPKFTTPGREKCGPPPAYDAPYGINNPAYDCETTGNAMP
ncbi:hypothetical protein ACF0H5_001613 [Mactra antiquata]